MILQQATILVKFSAQLQIWNFLTLRLHLRIRILIPQALQLKLLGYTLGKTKLGIAAENIEPEVGVNNDTTNTIFSIEHQLNDDYKIKLTYSVAEELNPALNDPTMSALGLDYTLSKDATLFGYWADGADGGLSADAGLVGDATVIAAGIIVKF